MNQQPAKLIEINRSLDGARVLFRHFLQTSAPSEGWIREVSNDDKYIRISRTNSKFDGGTWHRSYDTVIVQVLEEAKAPKIPKRDPDEEERAE